MPDEPLYPSEVSGRLGLFDRFATSSARFVSSAPFFAACVVLVAVWAPSYFVIKDLDLWQLLINTATTIVTFLLVALLQNSQHRADLAVQHKLNAMAEALADVLAEFNQETDIEELRSAVGVEHRESSKE